MSKQVSILIALILFLQALFSSPQYSLHNTHLSNYYLEPTNNELCGWLEVGDINLAPTGFTFTLCETGEVIVFIVVGTGSIYNFINIEDLPKYVRLVNPVFENGVLRELSYAEIIPSCDVCYPLTLTSDPTLTLTPSPTELPTHTPTATLTQFPTGTPTWTPTVGLVTMPTYTPTPTIPFSCIGFGRCDETPYPGEVPYEIRMAPIIHSIQCLDFINQIVWGIYDLTASRKTPLVSEVMSLSSSYMRFTVECEPTDSQCVHEKLTDEIKKIIAKKLATKQKEKIVVLLADILNDREGINGCKFIAADIQNFLKQLTSNGVLIDSVIIHSPVAMLVYDSEGLRTGIVDDGSIIEEIPGSKAVISEEVKYILLPANRIVKTQLSGTGAGSVTIDMIYHKDRETNIVSYNAIPVTEHTTGEIDLAAAQPVMKVDLQGSGQIQTITPSTIEVSIALSPTADDTHTLASYWYYLVDQVKYLDQLMLSFAIVITLVSLALFIGLRSTSFNKYLILGFMAYFVSLALALFFGPLLSINFDWPRWLAYLLIYSSVFLSLSSPITLPQFLSNIRLKRTFEQLPVGRSPGSSTAINLGFILLTVIIPIIVTFLFAIRLLPTLSGMIIRPTSLKKTAIVPTTTSLVFDVEPTLPPTPNPSPTFTQAVATLEIINTPVLSLYPEVRSGSEISWVQGQAIILNGEVSKIYQSDSQSYLLQLNDGRILITKIANQDDLFKFLANCGEVCNRIEIRIDEEPLQPVATFTLPPTLLPLTTPTMTKNSARVIWDTTHTPREGEIGFYTPDEVYSRLRSLLSGKQIRLTGGSISRLEEYDAVVIAAYSFWGESLSDSEAANIYDYVANGGGLILLGDQSKAPDRIENLARLLGIRLAQEPILTDVVDIYPHPITDGVYLIHFYQGGGLYLGDSGFELIGASFNTPAIAAGKIGNGRIVAIGDCNVFDNRWIGSADNIQFALNVFLWVTGIK